MKQKKTMWDLHRQDAATFRASAKSPLALVLDNVRSTNNVGSMLRTADAFALERVVLCGITATPPSPEIHKTALGAEESVAWEWRESAAEAVRELQRQGWTVCCLEQVHDSVSLDRFRPEPGGRYALVVGHEVEGVGQEVVDACDVCLEIPQFGTKHSLNVAVSAGMALWTLLCRLDGPLSRACQ